MRIGREIFDKIIGDTVWRVMRNHLDGKPDIQIYQGTSKTQLNRDNRRWTLGGGGLAPFVEAVLEIFATGPCTAQSAAHISILILSFECSLDLKYEENRTTSQARFRTSKPSLAPMSNR